MSMSMSIKKNVLEYEYYNSLLLSEMFCLYSCYEGNFAEHFKTDYRPQYTHFDEDFGW